jgi:hypothetical protein
LRASKDLSNLAVLGGGAMVLMVLLLPWASKCC